MLYGLSVFAHSFSNLKLIKNETDVSRFFFHHHVVVLVSLSEIVSIFICSKREVKLSPVDYSG